MFLPNTRILVVDDMTAMRQLVKNQLRNLGFQTIADANGGDVAWRVISERLPTHESIQLVLSDWNMPEGTGLDLLKKVRATPELKSLPFLMITAEGEQSQVVEAIRSGVSNYLVKPFTPAHFQEKLAAVWKKHNPGA